MQTSTQRTGAGKALPGGKARGKRGEGHSTKPKSDGKRAARIHGSGKAPKQRPACRVHWKNERQQHPALRYYAVALRMEMEKLGWSERDLAAASNLSPATAHRIVHDDRLPDMEQDWRLHRGLNLPRHTLLELAILLHRQAKAGKK